MSGFSKRHIGPDAAEKQAMLDKVGVGSVAELIDKTIPSHIRLNGELEISDAEIFNILPCILATPPPASHTDA